MSVSEPFSNIRDPSERIRALCKAGSQVEIDPTIPAKLYFRSGGQMIKMATVYFDEGSYESAFILFTKYITLFVEKLPRHADYGQATKADIRDVKKKLQDVFPIAEELKEKLRIKFTTEEKRRQEEEKKLQEQIAKEQERLRLEEEKREREEKTRLEKLRIESEELWIQEQEERFRQLQEKEREKLENDLAQLNIGADADLLPNNQTAVSGGAGYQQPIPNFVANDLSVNIPNVPSRELKKNILANDSNSAGSALPSMPSFDRSTKPAVIDHFTSIGSFEGSVKGLHPVEVPTDLMQKFLDTAKANTDRNVETCGILAGKLAHNKFHISHVLIPKQSGTSETCTTQNEEEIFDYQDSNDLLTLGWIHTHPSQTAFLSSVDLHTHYSYQVMLPEAIAIVCSPKYQETGVFMLTQDRGLSIIGNCREKGFHMHPTEPPLFENCPHVKLVNGVPITLKDFRRV